ncbi:MAG: hypothetical protein OSB00_20035 [Sphingomonas bacterium]|nr:hypothetical protein [Sphingomonas bacterium]
MTGGPILDSYEWPGGHEPLLRFGDGTPRVVLALPLFEEFNRTRAIGVTLLRSLAARGVSGLLPDFPGTGESIVPTAAATLESMRVAYGAVIAAYGPLIAIGMRSGALIDLNAAVTERWHFAPQSGEELLREINRQSAADGTIAGNIVSPSLREEIAAATLNRRARVVRLSTDPRPAHLTIDGAPPWRRVEPDNDPALVARLADDIADWIARCDG